MKNENSSNDYLTVNEQCLEKILTHLTKLICLTEFDDVSYLGSLVNMASRVSEHLLTANHMYGYPEDYCSCVTGCEDDETIYYDDNDNEEEEGNFEQDGY
jgi:hypothetical protein